MNLLAAEQRGISTYSEGIIYPFTISKEYDTMSRGVVFDNMGRECYNIVNDIGYAGYYDIHLFSTKKEIRKMKLKRINEANNQGR